MITCTQYYTGQTPGVNVSVIIQNPDGQVLMGIRRSGQFAGQWCLPGGKVDLGEKLIDAVRRETEEESGLLVEHLRLVVVSDILTDSAHFVNLTFQSGDYKGQVQENEPEEIGDWAWFNLDQPPFPLYHTAQQTLHKFVNGQLY